MRYIGQCFPTLPPSPTGDLRTCLILLYIAITKHRQVQPGFQTLQRVPSNAGHVKPAALLTPRKRLEIPMGPKHIRLRNSLIVKHLQLFIWRLVNAA
ncbi:hypothetical protein FKM82_026348 [Ascaphus truei]